jgi:hypothetical protein
MIVSWNESTSLKHQALELFRALVAFCGDLAEEYSLGTSYCCARDILKEKVLLKMHTERSAIQIGHSQTRMIKPHLHCDLK